MDEASLEIVDAGEMYPKQSFTSDDGIVTVPFNLLSGEDPLYRGRSAEGIIIITSYRFYHSEGTYINVPLGLIDYIECREIVYLYIYCKDGRSFRCIFDNNDETLKWLKRIQNGFKVPDKIDHCFAFRFLSWMREEQKDGIVSQTHCNLGALISSKDLTFDDITSEAERMGFDLEAVWKVIKINEDYKLCPSYPRYLIVPALTTDEAIFDATNYRYSKRIPTVVWRHQQNGCVIARSSQPKMGILSWRNVNDEVLIENISIACAMDPGYEIKLTKREDSFLKSDVDSDMSIFYGQEHDRKPVQKKLLIVDARSYTAAMTNRAKGGGYECDGYYPNCEVQYMGLANIHAIRNSFACLRALCAAPDDQNWLSSLESTKWLHHISGLIRAALLVVNAVDVEERPVLVHCSDGWDRTPQIVALAEILLDPYYRTKKGFQVLVEREWLGFGHKFADRCGHPDGTDDRNERSPVFLQWLDCIYQLIRQFQCHFEFNEQYLSRLVLHTYSCLFGTFLCNTDEDRSRKYSVPLRTFSVWPVLNEKSQFHNFLYNHSTEVLRPSCQIRSLKFWGDVYLPNSSIIVGRSTVPPAEEPLIVVEPEKTNLVKTKSCDNIHSSEHSLSLQRRKSDPNLVENTFTETINCPDVIDLEGELVPCPNSRTVEEPVNSDVSEDSVYSNGCENGNCERTDFKYSGLPPISNLALREPAIDGSTDTLVGESGAILHEQSRNASSVVRNVFLDPANTCSIATDTSDLAVAQNVNYGDCQLPNWCQNMIGAHFWNKRNEGSNSISCSYTTPNHSRTPSSGFPATPCDDPSDMPNLKKDSSACQIMDFDGLNIVHDSVQDRIKKLILHYKNKVGNLNLELSAARCEFLQQMCRQYHAKEGHALDGEDAPSLADSASSGEPHAESGGSEASWDLLFSPEHGTVNLGM